MSERDTRRQLKQQVEFRRLSVEAQEREDWTEIENHIDQIWWIGFRGLGDLTRNIQDLHQKQDDLNVLSEFIQTLSSLNQYDLFYKQIRLPGSISNHFLETLFYKTFPSQKRLTQDALLSLPIAIDQGVLSMTSVSPSDKHQLIMRCASNALIGFCQLYYAADAIKFLVQNLRIGRNRDIDSQSYFDGYQNNDRRLDWIITNLEFSLTPPYSTHPYFFWQLLFNEVTKEHEFRDYLKPRIITSGISIAGEGLPPQPPHEWRKRPFDQSILQPLRLRSALSQD
ncbi:MAG: hypothetical protein Alpg2KO_01010 [Alphaproteobacteria bacterium]